MRNNGTRMPRSRRHLLLISETATADTLPDATCTGENSYHTALMVVIFIACAGVAFAIQPALVASPDATKEKLSTYIQNITQGIHMLATLLLCIITVWYIYKRQEWIANRTISLTDNTIHPQYLLDGVDITSIGNSYTQIKTRQSVPCFQVVIFGCGCCFWLIFRVVQVIKFEQTSVNTIYTKVTDCIDVTLYVILIVLQIKFFTLFSYVIFPNLRLFQYSIALMAADKLWVWFIVTLRHYVNLSFTSGNEGNNNTTPNSTSFETVVRMTMMFLEPFFLEFLSISTFLLFRIWNKIGSYVLQNKSTDDGGVCGRRNLTRTKCAEYIAAENFHMRYDESGSLTSQLYKLGRHVSVLFVLILAFAFVSCNFLFTLNEFKEIVKPIKNNQNYIYRGIQITLFVPILIICPIVCHQLNKNERRMPNVGNIDFLLLFTATSSFLWFNLRLIAIVHYILSTWNNSNLLSTRIDKRFLYLYFIFTIGCILHVWVQTRVLVISHSSPKLKQTRLSKFCFLYIVIVNVSEWLQGAISRETSIDKESGLNPVMNHVFGELNTRKLTFLLYPVMELYNFHSAIMAYELVKK